MSAVAVSSSVGSGEVETSPSRSPWIGFAMRRMVGLLLTVGALVVVTFLIVRLIPGDPAAALAGPEASTAEVEAVRHDLGLDASVGHQFTSYVGGLLQGDLGQSFRFGESVTSLIEIRMPFTLVLGLGSIVLVLLLGVPLGMLVGLLCRHGRHRLLDRAFAVITGLLDSVPSYILATGLIVLLAVGVGALEWFPPTYDDAAPWSSLVLPILALSIGPVCTVARVVRRETGVILEEDYIRTARGWRVSRVRLLLRHALPNILTTTLTLSGVVLAGLLGGALIVETVFAVPGMGTGVIAAIESRDFPLIQGFTLVIGLVAALVHLVVDTVLALIDPRTMGDRHDNA